jgi:hypothetical protein
MYPQFREGAVRVLLETLRLGRDGDKVELGDIARRARATESFAREVLTSINVETRNGWISIGQVPRIHLAVEIARAGQLRDAARALTWQEFEKFAERCLEDAAFRTEKNVQVKGDDRRWQIDVVGSRGQLVLTIDCKHWNTPGSISRFKPAADHQRTATLHLLTMLGEKRLGRESERQALPMILTLSEPPAQFVEGAALVSVEKLPNFLSSVTPYDEDLPFLTLPFSDVENPMSQSN